jgi:hypothetical protein
VIDPEGQPVDLRTLHAADRAEAIITAREAGFGRSAAGPGGRPTDR